MRNRSSFHPTAPSALFLPARWLALPLCTLAAAVIIAGALTAAVPVAGEKMSSLSAQPRAVTAVGPVAAAAAPDEAMVALELDRLLTAYGRAVSGLGCWACEGCRTWYLRKGHKLGGEVAPGSGRSGSHIHGCTTHGSCGDHESCGGGGGSEVMSQIVRTLREATPKVLAAAVARHPQLMLNPDRGALQLVGCGGAIVASYPVATLASPQALPQQ